MSANRAARRAVGDQAVGEFAAHCYVEPPPRHDCCPQCRQYGFFRGMMMASNSVRSLMVNHAHEVDNSHEPLPEATYILDCRAGMVGMIPHHVGDPSGATSPD